MKRSVLQRERQAEPLSAVHRSTMPSPQSGRTTDASPRWFMNQRLQSLLLVLLLAVPLSALLQVSLFIHLPLTWILAFAVGSVLVLEVVGHSWKTALATIAPAGLLGLFLWHQLDDALKERILRFLTWAYGYLSVADAHPHSYDILMMAMVTCLVTLFVWFFGHRVYFFPALALFTVGFSLFEWLIGHFETLVPSIVSGGALVLHWVKTVQRRHTRRDRLPMGENALPLLLSPLVALALLISLGCVQADTAQRWQSRRVYDMFERVNNYLADYTGFTRPRSAFSLGRSGFMPMGSRLGGPVTLSEDEMLRVSTKMPLLLRGSIYNTYDGERWTDTLGSQRYRINNANAPTMADVFDSDRPAVPQAMREEYTKYTDSFDIHIEPVTNGPSTIFVPYRGVTAINSDEFLALLPYFNTEGEAFSTTDIRSGYGYTESVRYLNYRMKGFDELMAKLEPMGTGQNDLTEEEQKAYLALPSAIDPDIYQLVPSILLDAQINDALGDLDPIETSILEEKGQPTVVTAKDSDGKVTTITLDEDPTPYTMAKAIQAYLQKNYEYSLNPSAPPEGTDFVSYFLLQERRGYCTYFATAMTVMARMAGIPARYVEGYQVAGTNKNDDGSFTVLASDAHAWAELYFEGIGWIPFDATPSASDDDTSIGGGGGTGEAPIPTGQPMPTVDPEDDTTNLPVRKPLTVEDLLRIALWVLAGLALAAVAWVVTKAVRHRHKGTLAYARKHHEAPRAQYAYFYFDLLRLLRFYNYPVKRGETLYAFARRIDRWLRLETGTFLQVAEVMARVSYSDYQPTEQDVERIAAFRRELAHYTYHTTGWWFYLRYAVLGFPYRANPSK